MKTLLLLAVVLGLSIFTTTFAVPPRGKKMKAFQSERELKRYFQEIADKQTGNNFYVSADSVYVWATEWSDKGERLQSLLFRLPLDGSGPGALRVSGNPVDQFSFLQSDDAHLNVLVLGELDGEAEVVEDACRASCVDWYGNARPLFTGGRVIALIGYELVEGKLENGRLQEARRVSYAPVRTTTQR